MGASETVILSQKDDPTSGARRKAVILGRMTLRQFGDGEVYINEMQRAGEEAVDRMQKVSFDLDGSDVEAVDG
ncbi:MAG: hypothetical protein WBE13_21370 [Candidatus Acidiferrum sp.]